MLLGSFKQADSHSTCQKSAQPGCWGQRRTSCSLYGRHTFPTLDSSFRCAAIYKNFKDYPVALKYITVIYRVQKFITHILLWKCVPAYSYACKFSAFSSPNNAETCCVPRTLLLDIISQILGLLLCPSEGAVSCSSLVCTHQLKLNSLNPEKQKNFHLSVQWQFWSI